MELIHLFNISSVASAVLNHMLSPKGIEINKTHMALLWGLKNAKKKKRNPTMQMSDRCYGRENWSEWHKNSKQRV